MKNNGTDYLSSDGFLINMFENITSGDGACVVIKNGSLHAASCDLPAYFACENKYGCEGRAIAVITLFEFIQPFH
jgi:DNA integrity scanning protein DisA with diadenylate cyclase activity